MDVNRAAVVGVDQIVSVWETMNDGFPYFAVYYTNRTNKFFQWNKDDLEGAKNYLVATLQALEGSGDNQMYYLNVYTESRPNYKNSDMLCSFPMRLNPYKQDAAVGGYGGGGGDVLKALQAQHAENLLLTKKIADLEAANAELDWYDKVSGILENPGAAGVIVPLVKPVLEMVMGALGKMAGLAGPVVQPPMPYIAGPSEASQNNAVVDPELNSRLALALDNLEQYCELVPTLESLAKFAASNPDQFKMYLTMLPK